MGACYQVTRWLYFIVNFLVWMCGLGLVGIGLWLRFDPKVSSWVDQMSSGNDVEREFNFVVYGIIGLGVLLAFMGFLACCGALVQNGCMLLTFFVLVLIFICLQIAACVVLYLYKDNAKKIIEGSMKDAMRQYYNHNTENSVRITRMIDQLQQNLQCCGVSGYEDWEDSSFWADLERQKRVDMQRNHEHEIDPFEGQKKPSEFDMVRIEAESEGSGRGRIPQSCCNSVGKMSFSHRHKVCAEFDEREWGQRRQYLEPLLHTQGCAEKIFNSFISLKHILIPAAVGFIALQIASITMTLCMYCCQRRDVQYK